MMKEMFFNEENEKRFNFQLFLLLVFWTIAIYTFLPQMYNLPRDEDLTFEEKMNIRLNPTDPYTYYPLEYNPLNERMTLIESMAIWMGFFYGMLRIYNIMRIISEDDEEGQWTYFWDTVEK